MSTMNDKIHGGIRRAGQLPRTLIGVNGVRLINIPGVYYPATHADGKDAAGAPLTGDSQQATRLGYLQPTGCGNPGLQAIIDS